MQKRRIGQHDIWVSRLGLGTVKWGRTEGVKYPERFQLPSDQALDRLLGTAEECGINFLDTAPAYGLSEERIGKQLRGGKRQDWVISTKVGEQFVDGQSHFDFSAEQVTKSIETSLQRLKTDYLDIVLVHSNGDDVAIIEEQQIFSTLFGLQKAGKVRAFGMSTKTIDGAKLTLDHADVAMVAYHPGYTDEAEAIRYAEVKQKSIFIKKALASGHLENLGAKDEHPIQHAMRFILKEPGVTSIVVGTINPDHLRENAKLF